jgi:hypothetical protein
VARSQPTEGGVAHGLRTQSHLAGAQKWRPHGFTNLTPINTTSSDSLTLSERCILGKIYKRPQKIHYIY